MSEELIIRHCSPTLAGIKTGNMFSCAVSSTEELRDNIRSLNRILVKKGLRIFPLRYCGGRALIYVFRPSHLGRDLQDGTACRLLRERGYNCKTPEEHIVRLIRRISESEEFPHEVGLFLGYPPEDVCGFIENKATDCKCVGLWKVYGDEQAAKRLFARYKKCAEVYHAAWSKGRSIERLTVAV